MGRVGFAIGLDGHSFGTVQQTSDKIAAVERSIGHYRERGLRLVVSSSFQTHSIPLLHVLTRVAPQIPVAFLDTGYHFPETLTFRDEIADQLGLNLIVLGGHELRRGSGLYISSETACCNVNKVEPLHTLLQDFDVWVSGVRAEQTSTRQAFRSEMPGPIQTTRYHPMLTWTDGEIDTYRSRFGLPAHPLDAMGYRSIGCEPCTTVPSSSDRSGRWVGTAKTECGLHLTR